MTTVPNNQEISFLKVSSKTDAQLLRKSIVANIRQNNTCLVRCIGAAAISQTVKAHILANESFASKGMIIRSVPYFEDVPDTRGEEDKKVTSIVFKLSLQQI